MQLTFTALAPTVMSTILAVFTRWSRSLRLPRSSVAVRSTLALITIVSQVARMV
jgi:hypothetical protein